MKKISWGILSTAKIGLQKVIPAMQKGKYSEIHAIASRSLEKARNAANELGIPRAYASYQELLSDRDIDAVYIPLPNHLHVEWTIKALKAGKHVLCEKPLGLNFDEVEYLRKEVKNFPGLKVMEAFMYRHHPRWQQVKKLLAEEAIGELKSVHSMFAYYNVEPENIRNQPDIGGGGLLDIGCYCISLARFLFNSEPRWVCAAIEYDPELKIDRLVSALLEFEKGSSAFTCSTQLIPHQYAKIVGTQGKIEIEDPFTPQPVSSTKIIHQRDSGIEEVVFEACDHYTIQGDLFSQAILNDTEVPTPLEDGVANMKVIDRIKESSKAATWVII